MQCKNSRCTILQCVRDQSFFNSGWQGGVYCVGVREILRRIWKGKKIFRNIIKEYEKCLAVFNQKWKLHGFFSLKTSIFLTFSMQMFGTLLNSPAFSHCMWLTLTIFLLQSISWESDHAEILANILWNHFHAVFVKKTLQSRARDQRFPCKVTNCLLRNMELALATNLYFKPASKED